MGPKRSFIAALCVVLAVVALATAASAVTLDGIAPSSADRGTTLVATVSGSGFADGAQVALSRADTWIPAVRAAVESPSRIVCVLAVPADAPAGNYTLTLANGGIGPCVLYQKPDAFVVTVPPPGTVAFTADPPCGPAPLRVQFRVAPFPSLSTSPASYAWTFGDGAASTERDPVHVYGAAGRYAVTLAVFDAGGRTIGKAAGAVWVTPGTPPGGDQAFFLVDTTPAGAEICTEDLSGTRVFAGTTARGPVNVTVYLAGTPLKRIVANLSGYRDAVHEIAGSPPAGETVRVRLDLEPVAPPGPKPLIGTWRLVSFLGRDEADAPAAARPVPFITLSADGTFSGSVGCHHVRGLWTATGDEIGFSRIAVTERSCIDLCPAVDQEQRVLELLSITYGYRIDEPVLTLFDRAGRKLAAFERFSTIRPTDPDGDGRYDDLNGNGRGDFGDVVQFFSGLSLIAEIEAVPLFDYGENGRIDFSDVVWLFNHL